MLALLAACGERSPGVAATRTVALNGAFVLRLEREPDPLTLTDDAVRVSDARGRILAARTRLDGPRLVIRLVVDAALLADPPRRVSVEVAAGPSLVGLAARDGGVMPPARAAFEVRPVLEDAPEGGLRLVAWEARPSAGGAVASSSSVVELPDGADLVLRFDGVLDPPSVTGDGVPLFPVRGEAELPAVRPGVRWSVVGTSSEVVLDLAGLELPVRLRTRRLALRSLAGRAPEPRLELLLSAAGS
ncbi:MAG: hypothetical protein H6825_04465 [Planctomycetes bacterium]|nr:hypothetical protein [Planctomycetota bacterium]